MYIPIYLFLLLTQVCTELVVNQSQNAYFDLRVNENLRKEAL